MVNKVLKKTKFDGYYFRDEVLDTKRFDMQDYVSLNWKVSDKLTLSNVFDYNDIKDKKYLNDAIKKMCSYLKTRGYSNASSLNVKQLVNGPSGKDFQNIMTFLFRRVDPTFYQSPVGNNKQTRSDEVQIKFEDEVTMAFRCLGYPFPISKTGLVAVGSPHTWPALIAAIDWLVDVLVIRDEEDQLDWWGPSEDNVNVDNVDDDAPPPQQPAANDESDEAAEKLREESRLIAERIMLEEEQRKKKEQEEAEAEQQQRLEQ
mgnify:CR=1 FL=1